MSKDLSKDDVTELVKAYVLINGGAVATAHALGVSPDYIRKCMAGERLGSRVASAIGVVENERTWRRG